MLAYKYHPLFALLLGMISAFAMPPNCLWLALIIGLNGFYFLLSTAQTKRRAFLLGYAFGFGYFVTSMYWIGNALLVEDSGYMWAYPLGVVGFQGALALFYAFAALFIHWWSDLKTIKGAIIFAVIFGAIEWTRGWIFTGFPWNLFIYTWADALFMVQSLSFINTYIMNTFFIVLFITPMGIKLSLNPRWQKVLFCIVVASLSILNALDGYLSMNGTPVSRPSFPNIKIVQPNINQAEKWDKDKMQPHFQTHVDLSYPVGAPSDKTTFIVWPETAIPSWILNKNESRAALVDMLGAYENDVFLMTGSLVYDPQDGTYANSMIIFDKSAEPIARYDKHHLVPFGEFMPFQEYLPFGPVAQFQGFTRGAGVQLFEIGGFNVLPLVCYEIIFPGKSAQVRSDIIINITNDAWYGKSWGPHQHLAIAQFRAIETRTPIARAANTGISAVIDPYGRIIKRSPLFERAVVDYVGLGAD